MKGISIIIACYKAGDYLRETVESIHAVAPQIPYEIIIVDDASPDQATKSVLDDLSRDKFVRIFCQSENKGQSAARNVAINTAQYDYIFPIDADDKLNPAYPGYLDRAVDLLVRHPSVITIYSQGKLFGAHSAPFIMVGYSEKRMLVHNMIPVYGVYRRADALDIGGYNEDMRFIEDWEFWNALHNHRFLRGDDNRTTVELKKPYYLYRQHSHGHNVSVLQRISISESFNKLTSRAQPLYEHHFRTTDPLRLTPFFEQEAKHLHLVVQRALNAGPVDFSLYVASWVARRYSRWKNQRKPVADPAFPEHSME